jgi:hypothetical protein
MKHLNSLEQKKVVKTTKHHKEKDFWHEINRIARILVKDRNFHSFWDLREKYPDFVRIAQKFHDDYLIPLHNRNVVKKNISTDLKIYMYLRELSGGLSNAKTLLKSVSEYPSFEDWFNNATIKVYRGVPKSYNKPSGLKDLDKMARENDARKLAENANIADGQYKSFTLNIETAVKFTQSNWTSRGWIDKNSRNGWIFAGTIKVSDIHIFSNVGYEEECVIKGPFECTEVYDVVNGEVKKL